VLGFTYNFTNQSTQYQNGVDMHLDWSASQFLTKQFQAGVVGYVYKEVGCDDGSGNRVGCFQSQVVGADPQLGFVIPLSTTTQGYLNPRCYRLLPHKPLPSREALVLWIGLQPLWQVADIWPLRPADNRPNPCGSEFPHPKTRTAILRQAEPFDCHQKTAPTRLFPYGGPTRRHTTLLQIG
jgi:Putative MetA-pathway of phenol degradation